MTTFVPFFRYFSQNSALLPKAVHEGKSAACCPSCLLCLPDFWIARQASHQNDLVHVLSVSFLLDPAYSYSSFQDAHTRIKYNPIMAVMIAMTVSPTIDAMMISAYLMIVRIVSVISAFLPVPFLQFL